MAEITVEHGSHEAVRAALRDATSIRSRADSVSGEAVAGFRIDSFAEGEGFQVTFRLADGSERAFILDPAMLRALADMAASEVALWAEPAPKSE